MAIVTEEQVFAGAAGSGKSDTFNRFIRKELLMKQESKNTLWTIVVCTGTLALIAVCMVGLVLTTILLISPGALK